jgi:hypothetical protein
MPFGFLEAAEMTTKLSWTETVLVAAGLIVMSAGLLAGLAWLADRFGQNIDRRIMDQPPAICQAEPWRRYEEQCR